MTVRARQTRKSCYSGSIIPHEGEKLPSGEGSGDASCSLLIISSFGSSFAGADLIALFFFAETGLSPEGEAARLRFLGFGVSVSAVAGLLVESLWVLVWEMGSEVVRERYTFRIRRYRFSRVDA